MMGWIVLTEGHVIHNYYQLPLIPFASVIAGHGLRTLWSEKPRFLMLIGVPLLLYALLLGRRFVIQATTIDTRISTHVETLNAILPPKAPIVLISTHPQTLLHASGRKGAISNQYNPLLRSDYQEMGIEYIVIHQDRFVDNSVLQRSDFTSYEEWLIQKIVTP